MLLLAALVLFAGAANASPSAPRPVDCANTQRSVSPAQLDLFRIAFAGFQETKSRFQGRDWLNFESLIAFGNNAVDVVQLLYVLRSVALQIDPTNVTVQALCAVAQRAFLDAATRHEADFGNLPPQLAPRAAMQISALFTYATRFDSNHVSQTSLGAAKASLTWLLVALHDKCSLVTVGDGLAALWCRLGSLAVITNTGFDGSLFTLWTESSEAAFEAGYSVLVLMGPGQGES